MQCCFGFTPNPKCDNCDGTGIFSVDDNDEPFEPCVFCLEGAILAGEIDGNIAGIDYVKGVPQTPTLA